MLMTQLLSAQLVVPFSQDLLSSRFQGCSSQGRRGWAFLLLGSQILGSMLSPTPYFFIAILGIGTVCPDFKSIKEVTVAMLPKLQSPEGME
jgi:hypothetical protein